MENTSCPSGDITRVKTQYIIVRNGIIKNNSRPSGDITRVKTQ